MNKKQLKELMKQVDKTRKPKHWRKFINKETKSHNIILKCGKRAFCTHCQKYFDEDIKLNKYHKVKCKWCKKEYYVANCNVRNYVFLKDVAFFTKVNNTIVLRIFEVESKYDCKTRKFNQNLQEYVRFIPGIGIIRSDAISFFLYYMKVYHNIKNTAWYKYTGNKLLWNMSVYPYNKKHLYKSTSLQYAPIEELKKEYPCFRELKYLHIASYESFEYLWKMGLHKLALSANKFKKKGSFYKTFGVPKNFLNFMIEHNLDYYEYQILKLLQKADINLIKQYVHYNYNYLVFMKKQGFLYDSNIVKKFEYQENTLRKICKYATLKKFLQYEKGLKHIEIYKDYLETANELGLNLKPKNRLFPYQLIAWHDKLMKRLELKEDYKKQYGAYIRYLELSKYVYSDDKYIIFPAPSFTSLKDEGIQQGNCVSYIYSNPYVNKETEIYFIRKLKDVNKSFITLEYKDGRVVQKELPHHSINFKKEHLEFINKWQGFRSFIDNKEKYKKIINITSRNYNLNKLVA